MLRATMNRLCCFASFGFAKEAAVRGHYLFDGVLEDSDFYALLKLDWERQPQLHA